MKKAFKNIFSSILMLVLVVGCGVTFTACKDNDDKKVKAQARVMNISINPAVEFVLDKYNEVLSVNAVNDEGNFIISLEAVDFIGLDIDEATELFLSKVTEYGFIDLNASASDNKITIEISGEDSRRLYEKVKDNAQEYLKSMDVKNVSFVFDAITKSELQTLVSECRQDLSALELLSSSEAELITLIKDSRVETSGIFSQELKSFYYLKKAEDMAKAKFDLAKTKIQSFVDQGYNAEFEQANDLYDWSQFEGNTIYEKINNFYTTKYNQYSTYFSQLLDEFTQNMLVSGSEYREALNTYITAKRDLLKARLSENEIIDNEMQALQEALDQASVVLYGEDKMDDGVGGLKEELLTEFETIKIALASVKNVMDLAVNTLIVFIKSYDIENAVNGVKEEFNTNFMQEYADSINNNYWEELDPLKDLA